MIRFAIFPEHHAFADILAHRVVVTNQACAYDPVGAGQRNQAVPAQIHLLIKSREVEWVDGDANHAAIGTVSLIDPPGCDKTPSFSDPRKHRFANEQLARVALNVDFYMLAVGQIGRRETPLRPQYRQSTHVRYHRVDDELAIDVVFLEIARHVEIHA